MGKSSPRNPLWPDWFDGEKIDEVTFCHELIRNHPMKCIENLFFTPDGPVEDEAELKQLILKEIQAFIIHGLSKKVANLLESLRIIAYSAPLDIEVDCMDVERKGIQSYQSDIYARFLCFGNGALTALYDHSDGFWRRQLVLTTKDRPANREDNPFLVEALSAELEGILLWCLDGLQRLLRNSYKFTVSPKAAANLETIKRNSNNVLDFLDSEGYFRYKADFSISSKDLYEIYKLWCEDNACHPVSAARLSSEVSQNAVRLNLEPTNNIYLPGGRRVRGFVGIEALVYPAA